MSAENWNKIVAEYNKNRNSKEDIVQRTWEMLFSFVFNYSVLEIDSQRSVKMGCSTKFADIVIKNGHDDLFVVELKRHTLHEGREQLFSYLNQLKIDLGILVCDNLYIYDYDFSAREDSFSSLEIPFVPDNPDGIRFVEMFSKENLDKQKIKDFISESSDRKNAETEIRKSITSDFVQDLLRVHFTEKYPSADVDKILSEFSFSIARRLLTPAIPVTVATRSANTTIPVASTVFSPNSGCDNPPKKPGAIMNVWLAAQADNLAHTMDATAKKQWCEHYVHTTGANLGNTKQELGRYLRWKKAGCIAA